MIEKQYAIRNTQKEEAGQSLWEVIIALAIAALIAVGLVRVTGTSVKSSRFSTDQSQLTALAQQKISQIIDYKNKNYHQFWGEFYDSQFSSSNINTMVGSHEDFGDNYCLKTTIAVSSFDPPADATKKIAKITVKVFFDKNTETPSCLAGDYSHSQVFETDVTN